MAKTTAPLLSFGAAGQIGQTQVYSKWRGVAYARRYTIPANPRSTQQQLTRNTFATLRRLWLLAPPLMVAPWSLYAQGQRFLGDNAFIGQNIKAIRGNPNMQMFVGSPGAKGGLPPDGMTVTAGIGTLTVAFAEPEPPAGWTLDASVAIAFPDQDPAATFTGPVTGAESAAAPFDVTLTGLPTGTLHVVAGWLRWTKADGKTAYSASLVDVGTPG